MGKYKYRNKKTKAILETDCEISGGDWVEVKSRKVKEATPPEESELTGNEGSGDGMPVNDNGDNDE